MTELTVVSEAHVSHYRSHLGVGCLVVFDPYLHSDRTAHRDRTCTCTMTTLMGVAPAIAPVPAQ